MTATFVYTNTPGMEFGPLPVSFPDPNFTAFTMDIANTSEVEPESGKPFQSVLLDGQTWELPVLVRQKQKIETLPNLVLAGTSINLAFHTWRDLLLQWHYARARWIQTDGFIGPTKVVRSQENFPFEQMDGITFAVRASFEVTSAGVGAAGVPPIPSLPPIPMQLDPTRLPPNINQTDTVLYERPVAFLGVLGAVGGTTLIPGVVVVAPFGALVGGLNSLAFARSAELIQDIVFSRYENGQEVFSFSLGIIPKALAPVFEEMVVPSPIGPAGTGIWKITGDLPLYDNSSETINALKRLAGLPLHMQILYKSGRCVGTLTLGAGGASNGFASDRFNNLLAYRPLMGVAIQVKDESAGYRRVHLVINGATAEKYDYQTDPGSFYGLFKKLNLPN